MEYFIADTHWNHKNITGPKLSRWKSGYRDFDSIEEMNEAITDSINSRVGKNDILYHLGDISFGNLSCLYSLKCENIILILGNHDNYQLCKEQPKIKKISSLMEITTNNRKIVMCHYSMRVWNDSHKDSYHLFGHTHHTIPNYNQSMDVGWCKWRKPLNFKEIDDLLNNKEGQGDWWNESL